jgi:POT family proton-dependent oligopeptide transporter
MSNSGVAQHPYGLRFLFLTEMWERFGYYLMIGIFTLYMEDTAKGGLGFATSKSTDVFGTFIALAYLTPFLGGIIADKLLGYRRSIIIGGTLMGIGYCCLGISDKITQFFTGNMGVDVNTATNYALWFSLIIMVIGNGFFKPNIATLLGNLYNDPQFSAKKDIGYNIFYMGINIGAFVCNFAAAFMRGHYGWWAAFLCAGIGMFLGVFTFVIGNKHYAHADAKKVQVAGEQSLLSTLSVILVPAVLKIITNVHHSDN